MSLLNKRAESEISGKTIFFIFVLVVLTIVFFGVTWVVYSFDSVTVLADDSAYVDTYKERFLGTPGCFAYVDFNTGNVYSGIIDISKFTSEQLNSCYIENTKSPYEFFLTLQYNGQEKKIASENYKTISAQYTLYVLVYENGKTYPGKLLVGAGGLSE